jgi:hypothetical protein
LHKGVGFGGGGGAVIGVATQDDKMNVLNVNLLIFSAQQILNYSDKYKEIQ